MQLATIDFFNSSFANEQMNFLFSGDFSDDLTDRLIELNSAQFDSPSELKSLQRKSAFLIAECFQNIVRHSDLTNSDSYFHIKNNKELFSLISGNSIKSSFAPILQKQLEELNKLTDQELKEAFRKTLCDGEYSSKGGAGIGLIGMARKSKNKLRFSFSAMDEIRSYFYFQMLMKLDEQQETSSFETNIELRNIIKQENIFMVYKGSSSTKVNNSLYGIMKPKLDSTDQGFVYFKLIELLQKIVNTGSTINHKNSILLLLGEGSDEFTFGASCETDNKLVKSIERAFKLYKTYSKDQLESEYNKLLLDDSIRFNEIMVRLIEFITYSNNIDLTITSLSKEVSKINITFQLKKKPESEIVNIPIKSSFFKFFG